MAKMLLSSLILLIIATSCTSPLLIPSPSPTSHLRTMEVETRPTLKQQESNNTSTPFLSSPTMALTPTPSTVNEAITQKCFHENVSLPITVVPAGILVIRKIGDGISLFRFPMGTQQDITGNMHSIGISPDGEWLAYEVSENDEAKIMVESIDGKKFRVSTAKSWALMNEILWMDNQRVWFPEISNLEPAPSILVLNPFTGKKDLLKTDYPGIPSYNYGSGSFKLHFGYSSVLYDPTLNYVIYPEYEQGNSYFQTLWDRKLKKVIARVPSSDYYQNLPIWQGTHKQFLLVGFPNSERKQNEWISVSLDGQINHITNLGNTGQKYIIENNAVLSPDGNTLAFSLSHIKDGSTDNSSHLILLNLETGKVRDTCLPVDRITWSLDGQYLAVSTPIRLGANARVLLIDLKSDQSYQLLESSKEYPIGWLKQP